MTIAKFAKSPLTEVVCGVEFSAPGFSAVHFGLYWQAIRERFPVLPLDRPPIGDVELLPILPKLRRVWFESADKQQLIQLQSNRFHYNWRRQSEEEEYPHFEDIYPRFEQEWQSFQEWWIDIGGLPLQPLHYELTYLNQLDSTFGWNESSDASKIFTFAGQDWTSFLTSPKRYSSEFEFLIPNNLGTLVISLTQGLRVEDNAPLAFFELTSRSADATSEPKDWFHPVHSYTVRAFLDLLKDEIKKEWGFKWLAQ